MEPVQSLTSSVMSQIILPPPQHISTPKSKEALAQDRAETKREAKTEGELQDEEEEIISMRQTELQRIDNRPNIHQVNATDSQSLNQENLTVSSRSGEDMDTVTDLQPTCTPTKVASDITLKSMSGPKHVKIVTSISTGAEINSAQSSKVSIKRRPPRAPSRLLQRSISQKSSSSELSDDSSHSDDSEKRDKFDPSKVFH